MLLCQREEIQHIVLGGDAERVPIPDCDSDGLISLSNFTSVSRTNRRADTAEPEQHVHVVDWSCDCGKEFSD